MFVGPSHDENPWYQRWADIVQREHGTENDEQAFIARALERARGKRAESCGTKTATLTIPEAPVWRVRTLVRGFKQGKHA